MLPMWCIRNDEPTIDFVRDKVITLGWDEFGDICLQGMDRGAIKLRLTEVEPNAKPGAIPVQAGILFRFAYEMAIGDYIVHPSPVDRTLSFGRIESDYFWASDAPTHRSRRRVTWLRTGVSRSEFEQSVLFELGSIMTLFRVKTHASELEQYVSSGKPTVDLGIGSTEVADVEKATLQAEEAVTAQRIEVATRDFIINALMTKLTPTEFEHFVADVLRAHGYFAVVTPPTGDLGVDVIASRGELGLEPPRIKVQVKRMTSTVGGPDVAHLKGVLAGSELGLFVTLGTFSKDAIGIENGTQSLRLINGDRLVDLVLSVYDSLPVKQKMLIPLKRTWVVDQLE